MPEGICLSATTYKNDMAMQREKYLFLKKYITNFR